MQTDYHGEINSGGRSQGITRHTVVRMAVYYQALQQLIAAGVEIISSDKLGADIGITSAVIRKDLACFGGFGTKGIGYSTAKLMQWIGEILGYYNQWNMAFVGQGITHSQILHYQQFMPPGFRLAAILDTDEKNWGNMIPEIGLFIEPLHKVEQVVQERDILIGVIAVGEEYVQEAADCLAEAGVSAIGNLSEMPVALEKNILLVQHSVFDGLIRLSHLLWRDEIMIMMDNERELKQ